MKPLLGILCVLCLLPGCGPQPTTYKGDVSKPRTTEQSAEDTTPAQDTVHATRTGKRYHRATCRHLAQSDIPMTLVEAQDKGLTPCGTCKP